MARWTAMRENFTPVAVADATNFTDAGYFALQGGSSTQVLEIVEISISGLAAASAASQLLVARDSTVGATLSGGSLAAQNPATAALAAPPVQFSTATTKPQRSATLKLLAPSFNTFGGIYRWQVNKGDGLGMLGNAASFGETSLSHASSGTAGLISCHIIFEPQ